MTALEKPPGVAAILKHPDGTDVFLVGTGHISPTSVLDAISAIETIKPGAVLLELDQDRHDRRLKENLSGDKYGIARFNTGSLIQDFLTVLRGQAKQKFWELERVILGAVCGSPSGYDMVAANVTATKVGARVVLGDRPSSLTRKRVAAAKGMLGDPWWLDLAPDKALVWNIAHMKKKKMSEAKSGTDGEAAMAAIKSFLEDGWGRKFIDPIPLAKTRFYVLPIVEHARQQILRECTVAEVTGSGLESSVDAFKETVSRERNLILARNLYETAETTEGRPVVGVVGAAHVKGITQAWPTIDSPDARAKVQEFMKVPPANNRGGQVASAALTAGLVGLAYKRPRAALLVVGAGAVVMTSFIIFTTYQLNRWRKLAIEAVAAAEKLDRNKPSPF